MSAERVLILYQGADLEVGEIGEIVHTIERRADANLIGTRITTYPAAEPTVMLAQALRYGPRISLGLVQHQGTAPTPLPAASPKSEGVDSLNVASAVAVAAGATRAPAGDPGEDLPTARSVQVAQLR